MRYSRRKKVKPQPSFDKGFTYVANPYSSSDPDLMHTRYERTAAFVAKRMRKGEVLYSPIVHHHQMAIDHKLPTDWPFWRNIDGTLLAAAQKLTVLKLTGWEKSVGVQAEIAIALARNIPVEYAEPV